MLKQILTNLWHLIKNMCLPKWTEWEQKSIRDNFYFANSHTTFTYYTRVCKHCNKTQVK